MSAGPGLRPRSGRAAGTGTPSVLSPAPVDAWKEVLDSAPRALPTQSPEWLECVCAVDGYANASRLYRSPDGRRLVLPLVRRTFGAPLIAMESSLPIGWGAAGLLGEGGTVRPEDVHMVVADLAGRRTVSVSLRPDPSTVESWEQGCPPWVQREPRMAQTLCLAGGFDEVWRTRFRSDTRNRVRRAERANVVVERDDTGRLVPVVRELYARSVDRWAHQDGVPIPLARWRAARLEPSHKLPTVARVLGPRCRIYAAFVDGRPAAAIVVLLGQAVACMWRGAMDEELAGPTYATYLLHRTAIEDAAEAGCVSYHLGDSAPGSSLALFKSRFGAAEQHYAGYRLDRIPMVSLARRARGLAGATLRRMRGRG
ncbi:GNAT family N-acetyltransferase [Dactylosporangium sp. CA-139114]|uniref:GNAT family N-acetyltransferase n=1 Tax=Dactylosporangium sp. CA-139114 TaxID=3239931 RepID=UPI003D98DFDA